MISTGANLTHLRPPARPTGDTDQWGAVATWHAHATEGVRILQQMRSAGMTSLRIPLVCVAEEELGTLRDGFTLALTQDSRLDAQSGQNLAAIVGAAREEGFDWVCVGPGGEGRILGASNWPDLGTRWERLGNLVPWILGIPGVDCVDLGELIIPSQPVVMAYARTVWTWATTAYGNTRVTMGLTAGVANAIACADVYQGLDPVGLVNWPKELGLHLYGPTDIKGEGSLYSIGSQMIARLDDLGCTSRLAIHEMFDWRDKTSLAEARALVRDTGEERWARVLEWPILPGQVDFGCAPSLTGANFGSL